MAIAKLFAGMGTISASLNPARSASATTSSMSLYPHSLFRPLRLASNVAFPSDVCLPSRLNGPYTNSSARAARRRRRRRSAPSVARARRRAAPCSRRARRRRPRRLPRVRETSPGALVSRAPPLGVARVDHEGRSDVARARVVAHRVERRVVQVRGQERASGSSPERCAQCCPVPHASSTTTPPVGAHALSRGANASAIGTLSRSAAEEEAALFNVPKSLDMVSASGAGSGEAEARVAKGARARRTPGLAARDRAEQTLARAAAETRQSSEAIGRSPRGVTKVWAMEASRPRKLGACAGIPSTRPATNNDRNLPIVRADATDDVMQKISKGRESTCPSSPTRTPPRATPHEPHRTSRNAPLAVARTPLDVADAALSTTQSVERDHVSGKCRPRPLRRFRAEALRRFRSARRAAPRRAAAAPSSRAPRTRLSTPPRPRGRARGAGRVSPTRRTASMTWSSEPRAPDAQPRRGDGGRRGGVARVRKRRDAVQHLAEGLGRPGGGQEEGAWRRRGRGHGREADAGAAAGEATRSHRLKRRTDAIRRRAPVSSALFFSRRRETPRRARRDAA